MKKSSVLFLLATAVMLWSCSGNQGEKKESSGEQKSETKKEQKVEKKLVLTVKLGDEAMKFDKVTINNSASTPGEKSDSYSVCGGVEKENELDCVFSMDFTAKGPGPVEEVSIFVQGHQVKDVKLELQKFKTGVKKYNGLPVGVTVESIQGTFSGKFNKLNSDGFPTKEVVELTGTIEK